MIPPLCPGSCQLWWASAEANHSPLLGLLDRTERRRYHDFVRVVDRSLFAVSHALLRIVVGHHAGVAPGTLQYAARAGTGAKPRFLGAGSGLQFSISHSGSKVLLAIGREAELGVDVELVGRETPHPSLVEAVLSLVERRALSAMPTGRQPWGFSRYWSRKEALLKAAGEGLAISPRRIVVSAPGEAPALLAWEHSRPPVGTMHLYDLDPGDGYCAALAAVGAPLRRSHHAGDTLLEALR